MSDKQFAEGIFFNPPHDKAPDFVVGKIAIVKDKFLGWLDQQQTVGKGYVNLQVKRSRDGKMYLEVDTWEPKAEGRRTESQRSNDDDVPF